MIHLCLDTYFIWILYSVKLRRLVSFYYNLAFLSIKFKFFNCQFGLSCSNIVIPIQIHMIIYLYIHRYLYLCVYLYTVISLHLAYQTWFFFYFFCPYKFTWRQWYLLSRTSICQLIFTLSDTRIQHFKFQFWYLNSTIIHTYQQTHHLLTYSVLTHLFAHNPVILSIFFVFVFTISFLFHFYFIHLNS